MNIPLLLNKVFGSIREDGIGSTIAKSMHNIRRVRAVDEFDRQFGTDTWTTGSLYQFEINSQNAKYGVKYQTTDGSDIQAAVDFIGLPIDQFDFADLGSGKGRMLILASRLGFRRVTGVEFARELYEISLENLRKAKAGNVNACHMDAADYVFPAAPLLIYMYNPFHSEVLAGVVENLRPRCMQEAALPLYIVYSRPEHRAILDAAPFLECLGHPNGRDDLLIWKAVKL